jgi:chromate transporter
MTSPAAEAAAPEPSAWSSGRAVSRKALFLGFLRIGVTAFGGVAPIARFELVERRRWLSDAEYATLLGIGKVLPGANTINVAVMVGDRFQGPWGALIAVVALIAMPIVIAVALVSVYARYAAYPLVQAAMTGAGAAAAGMVVGTGLKMAAGLGRTVVAVAACGLTLLAIGVLRWPMIPVLLVLAPAAVAGMAWAELRPPAPRR